MSDNSSIREIPATDWRERLIGLRAVVHLDDETKVGRVIGLTTDCEYAVVALREDELDGFGQTVGEQFSWTCADDPAGVFAIHVSELQLLGLDVFDELAGVREMPTRKSA